MEGLLDGYKHVYEELEAGNNPVPNALPPNSLYCIKDQEHHALAFLSKAVPSQGAPYIWMTPEGLTIIDPRQAGDGEINNKEPFLVTINPAETIILAKKIVKFHPGHGDPLVIYSICEFEDSGNIKATEVGFIRNPVLPEEEYTALYRAKMMVDDNGEIQGLKNLSSKKVGGGELYSMPPLQPAQKLRKHGFTSSLGINKKGLWIEFTGQFANPTHTTLLKDQKPVATLESLISTTKETYHRIISDIQNKNRLKKK